MVRFLSVAAVAAAALSFTPATSFAQTAGGYYSATPVAAPAKDSLITRTTLWKCGEGTCIASKSNSRDAIMCELMAKEVGALSGFTANGQAFDADALAKCNTKARGGATQTARK